MLATQRQSIASYQRVQQFLVHHPPPESPGYLAQKKALDDAVEKLVDHAANQVMGRRLSRAAVQRQRATRRTLREEHLRPISKIARATLADAPGIEKALKMPRNSLTALDLVAEATAIRNAITLYEPTFVQAGMPADFLQQLEQATEAVHQSVLGKARSLGRQVGAGVAIEREIKRARQAVELIDTIVTKAFRNDPNALGEWRTARRVQSTPGGGSAEPAGSEATPAVTPIVGPVTPSAAA